MPSSSPPPFVFLLPILIPLWIAFVFFIISRASGWHCWATHFPAGPTPPPGTTFSWLSARVGSFGNYNNCLQATISAEGVHLIPLLVFRPFHRPMLLPWSVVDSIGNFSFLFSRYLYIHFFADGRRIKLALPPRARDAVRDAAPANISVPPPL